MITSHALAPALFALSLGALFVAPQDGPAPEVEPEVRLELLADTEALVPGGEFMLAAWFELPEEWHIYWENAGESGMPTSVSVTAPEGFLVGEPLYPGPKSLEVGLEITSFVYEDEVAIFVPVTVPAELDSSASHEFTLEAEWLVCKKECFLQEGKRSLSLKVAEGAAAPAEANAKRLAPQRAKLPRPQSELEGLRWQWMKSPPEYRALTVVVGAVDVEFFPGLESNLIVTSTAHNPGSNAYEMAIDFMTTPGQEADQPHAVGVLRVETRKDTHFYRVDFSATPKGAAPR